MKLSRLFSLAVCGLLVRVIVLGQVVVAPVVSGSSNPIAAYLGGIPFQYSITASNSPTSYGATGLPSGLTVNNSTGLISGIPSAAGSYPVQLTASNTAGTGTGSITIAVNAQPVSSVTFAGDGNTTTHQIGNTDGTGTAARFNNPYGIARDSSGNLYVTDAANATIRKISPAGVVTTLAGTAGTTGSADGAALSAAFNFPKGIVVDGNGNFFVADSNNDTIREITATGTVSTFAGSAGQAGSADGQGTLARFNAPDGVAIDSSGNVYVSDSGNSTVRVITPTGLVSTLAGTAGQTGGTDGTGVNARFNNPSGLTIDSAGNLYLFDTLNHSVRKITQSGVVTTLAQNLTVPAPGVVRDSAITTDLNGNVYIILGPYPAGQQNDSQLLMITPSGVTSVVYTWFSTLTGNPNGIATDGAGDFFVTSGLVNSGGTIFEVSAVTGPSITTQPQSQLVAAGQSATFHVRISSTIAATYNWQFNGAPLSAASNPTVVTPDLTISNATTANNGNYSVIVSTIDGAITSNSAALTVSNVPVISTQPQPQSSSTGGAVTLTVNTWPGSSYQWTLNGTAIAGATSNTLTLGDIGTDQAGSYQVIITNANGSATSNAVTVAVSTDAHLINLSSLAFVPTGGSMTAGFVVSGSGQSFATGQGQKSVLIRGIGPTLSQFGITDALAAPQLTLFNGLSAVIDSNATWGGTTALTNAFTRVYAFPLPPASKDTALLETLNPGSYTAQVSAPTTAGGTALAEVYDADQTPSGVYLINISTLGQVDTSGHTLVAGFVITGTASETVLIRGIGPTLSQYGVATPLTTPSLALFDSKGNIIATNTGWGGSASLATAFARVHAFALPATSADTAIEMTLAPGTYTAQVSGLSGATGNHALVEIYEVK